MILKCLIIISVILGLTFSFINYKHDGYSDWHKRLLYFTTQSGIWIFLSSLTIIVINFLKKKPSDEVMRAIYIVRYVFTVSITVTGVVFCALLAPFADSRYHPWSYFSILNHVVTPLLAIGDFFVDENRVKLGKICVSASVIPPLLYFIFSTVLSIMGTDFGRGDPYPYFFMDLNSPAGFFGLSREDMAIGTFWWILLFLLLVLGLGALYAKLNNRLIKNKSD